MPIFGVCFFLVLFLAFIFGRKFNDKSKKAYIIGANFFLILFCSIRSIEVGPDTFNYVEKFHDALTMSWSDLPQMVIQRYVLRTEETDVGFIILEKLVTLFTPNFQIYTFIIDLIFFIPFGIFLYRYTNNLYQLVFAYVFFISLVYVFFLSGGRQMQAMGFELMSFFYIIKDKYIKALILTLIGMLIHLSMLLVVPYILACWFFKKKGKVIHLITIILYPLVLISVSRVLLLMSNFIGMDRYSKYGEVEVQGGATVFIAMILFLSVFCYIAIRKRNLQKSVSLQKLYMALPFMTITGPLIYSNGSMIRICLYYFIFMTLLVPTALELSMQKSIVKKTYVLAIAVLIVLKLASGGIDYDFFWNDQQGSWNY